METDRWPCLVGGHVVLDFVNTDIAAEHDRTTDVLCSVDEFLAWWEFADGTGSPTVTGRASSRDGLLADARSMRAAMRATIDAIVAGGLPDERHLTTLRDMYHRAIGIASPSFSGGHLTWRWTASDPAVPLWEVTVAAIDLLRDGPIDRIKACPACRFVFLDTTKNRSRRWCSMDDCGKQEKIRRYLAKRAQRR